MVQLKARSIWDYIFTGAVSDNIWEERKKGFSLAVFISMFGLFKGAIQLCHCCQAFKTVYIHDKGIYLIVITSLPALPDSPVTCKLIAFKQELEKKKLIGMHHYP